MQATAGQLAQLTTLCPQAGAGCAELFRLVGNSAAGRTFAAVVRPDGSVTEYGDQPLADSATLAQLAGLPAVAAVRSGPATQVQTVVVLAGARPQVAVLGVAAPTGARPAGTAAPFVAVYGVLLDDAYLADSRATSGGYDLTLLVDGRVGRLQPGRACRGGGRRGGPRDALGAGRQHGAGPRRPPHRARPPAARPHRRDRRRARRLPAGSTAALAAERRALRDLFRLALPVTAAVAGACRC